MRITSNRKLGWIALALAQWAVGCRGGAPPFGASAGGLLEDEGEALGSIEEEAAVGAQVGCEDRLEGGERFAIISGEPGLVAAVDAEGHVICVDTVEAVEEELEESGRDAEADRLVSAYWAAISSRGAMRTRIERRAYAGDPDPEPNIEDVRIGLTGESEPRGGR
jgi:hypothetical protein